MLKTVLRLRNTCLFGIWLCVLGLLAPATYAQVLAHNHATATRHVRLLTIGNSFSRNATRFLNDLVEAGGHRLTHQSIVVGGASLQLHAEKGLAFEDDPLDKAGLYSNGRSLQQELQAGEWDFVTIQQASIKSHNIDNYRPYAAQLKSIISRHAPMAELLVHQTWAYRQDDPRFAARSQDPSEPVTQAAMSEGLNNAYETIARELSARRIPVGDAFTLADNDSQFGYRPDKSFDQSAAKYPELPNQDHSLHVGWRWQKGVQPNDDWTLKIDGHHASIAGEYLGACVWYETLLGESCVGNTFAPPELDRAYVNFLQRTAHSAVSMNASNASVAASEVLTFDDPSPQQYRLKARASVLDSQTKEYPEINFVFGTNDKPQDEERASVDTRVAPQGKLVIWLMGHNEALFDRLNSYGLHAIQVSYANKWFGALCRPRPKTSEARGNVRLEAATGQDISDELALMPPDGMMERAFHMVRWLAKENPQGHWEHFLREDGLGLRWDRVIISGSSHGSTTAARFAQYQRVDRVVMLCGPRDQDQDWQAGFSATPTNRFFGFSHVLDGGWTGDHYCRSWELLGLHQYGPIVNVDTNTIPFSNTRRLLTAADVNGDANRAHSSVTPGRASPQNSQGELLFEPVWKYLYTHPIDLTGPPTEKDASCLPDSRE